VRVESIRWDRVILLIIVVIAERLVEEKGVLGREAGCPRRMMMKGQMLMN
jgi:hypothetical protein